MCRRPLAPVAVECFGVPGALVCQTPEHQRLERSPTKMSPGCPGSTADAEQPGRSPRIWSLIENVLAEEPADPECNRRTRKRSVKTPRTKWDVGEPRGWLRKPTLLYLGGMIPCVLPWPLFTFRCRPCRGSVPAPGAHAGDRAPKEGSSEQWTHLVIPGS